MTTHIKIQPCANQCLYHIFRRKWTAYESNLEHYTIKWKTLTFRVQNKK